jgi:ankyrin repeat protein
MLDVALPRCRKPPQELLDRRSALADEVLPPDHARSRQVDDAQSSLAPSPEKAVLLEDGDEACSTLTPEVLIPLSRRGQLAVKALSPELFAPKGWVAVPPEKVERHSPGGDATLSCTSPTSKNSDEERDPVARTPLMVACDEGDRVAVQLLIAGRAKIEARDLSGQTPLIIATRAGHANVVKGLLFHGADLESRNAGDNTPLLFASAAGQVDIVKLLLSSDADIEARNLIGMTPLMVAARGGHARVVKKLLKKEADRSVVDEQGRTAQQYAELAGHDALAKLLMPKSKSKPKPKSKSKVRRTLLKRKRV